MFNLNAKRRSLFYKFNSWPQASSFPRLKPKKMILLIDTAQESGIVALAKEGRVMLSEENKIAKEHAAWLSHPAIRPFIVASAQNHRPGTCLAVGGSFWSGIVYRITCWNGSRQGILLCVKDSPDYRE